VDKVRKHDSFINIQSSQTSRSYEGESVNRSQIHIKRKTCDIRTKKKFISGHIFHQHWYTCPIALPVRRNPQHRSLSTVVSATSAPPFHHLRLSNVFEIEFRDPVINRFTRQTFPIVNREHFFFSILCISSFCLQKTHNRTLLFGITLLKHRRYFDYWNQPLNMRVCYLEYHEAGLCCYLVTHIKNLLRPLQLFYFYLWPIYRLALILKLFLEIGLGSSGARSESWQPFLNTVKKWEKCDDQLSNC
jgi:hypothetical protein